MPNQNPILIVGGAGYIGSHVVRQLGEAGYPLVIYDNYSTGSPNSITYGEKIQGDLANIEQLYQLFAQYSFRSVIHFAASLVVPESVTYPLNYYTNNTRNTLNLLRCCNLFKVENIIFSSTAAVYGEPQTNPVPESAPLAPINPYGRSKLMSEWMIRDYAATSACRYVILRYFNVAGASLDGRLGQIGEANHLIRATCDAVLRRKPEVHIFGTDFPTPDGTAIRDFIHVEDLAAAHVNALRYLEQKNPSQILNCGYGQGYSVQQVIDRMKEITHIDFPVITLDRRPGDPACVTAHAEKIQTLLEWKPKYNHLDLMLQTALAWEIHKELNTNSCSPWRSLAAALHQDIQNFIEEKRQTDHSLSLV